jgi:GTPase SAR1 family protein
VTARSTFERLGAWIEEVRDVVDDIVLIVCGNKIDLTGRRAVDGIDAAAFATDANAAYGETSAKTGAGIEQLFATVVREVSDKRPELLEALVPVQRNGPGCC